MEAQRNVVPVRGTLFSKLLLIAAEKFPHFLPGGAPERRAATDAVRVQIEFLAEQPLVLNPADFIGQRLVEFTGIEQIRASTARRLRKAGTIRHQ